MNCPKCGDKNAECIIGNFWKCPTCDAPPEAEPDGYNIIKVRDSYTINNSPRVVWYISSVSSVPTTTGNVFYTAPPSPKQRLENDIRAFLAAPPPNLGFLRLDAVTPDPNSLGFLVTVTGSKCQYTFGVPAAYTAALLTNELVNASMVVN